jgi:hypothetical protein
MERKKFDLYYTYNNVSVPFSQEEQVKTIQEKIDKLSILQKNQVILLCFEYCFDKNILKDEELALPPFIKQVESDVVIDLENCSPELILKMFKMIKVLIGEN